jgi:hypothetical protein
LLIILGSYLRGQVNLSNMKTLQIPNEIILEIASFGLHKEIRQLDKWFNNKIPKNTVLRTQVKFHENLLI